MNISVILAKVAGLSILVSDVVFAQSLTNLFGDNGTKILGAIGLASSIAGEIMQYINSSMPPAPTVPPAV